ncbi:DUF6114 domain-containing protein [Longispora sp. NPDC051575]|uniref:DUF6114 domain-containing protein n=1 Tax=Longispora sp. NPDC051575 TaxID=3154943 RepID=UPI00341B62CD
MSTNLGQVWRSFGTWRRGRPFWGGLLALLSGSLLIWLPWTTIGTIIRAGMGALGGVILGSLIALCGVMMWFQPAQRVFYSVITIVAGLAAFPFTNFGGFVVGTLLALVGGSLGFAWTPVTPAGGAPPAARVPDDGDYSTAILPGFGEPDADLPEEDGEPRAAGQDEPAAEPASEHPGHAGQPGQPGPGHAGQHDSGAAPGIRPHQPRHRQNTDAPAVVVPEDARSGARSRQAMGVAILAVSVAATGLMAMGMDSPVQAAPPSGAIPCAPGQTAPGQPPAGQPTKSGQPAPGPTAKPEPTKSGQPAPTPTATAPAPGVSPEPTKPWWWPFDLKRESDSSAPRRVAAAPAKATPTPTGSPMCHRQLAAAAGDPVPSAKFSDMRAAKQQMWGMHYDGVKTLKTKEGGSIRVLKFTMTKAQSTPFEMTSPDKGNGRSVNQKSTQLTISGDVEFYTSRFHGWLFGIIPLTFTPDSPPPLQIADPIFTSAEIELVYLKCDRLQADDLRLTEV